MDFLAYREAGHIRGPSGKGQRRALDIGRNRGDREISHVCVCNNSGQKQFCNSLTFGECTPARAAPSVFNTSPGT